MIFITALECVIPGVCILMNRADGIHCNVIWQNTVESAKKGRRYITSGIEMRHIVTGMHTCIGAPAARHADRLPEDG